MAVVETLEVQFQADMSKLSAQLNQLAAQVGSLSDVLNAGKTNLAFCASGLIQTVADGLRSGASMSVAPMEAGNMLTSRFAEALLAGRAQAEAAARQVSAAADFSDAGAVDSAHSAGAALSQGFANGISSKHSAVMSAVNNIVSAAIKKIRSALSIHSPSKVSFELGGFFGEGFAEGIYASVRMAQRSVQALSDGAVGTLGLPPAVPAGMDANGLAGMMRAAVNDALGGTSIVIPLHVDGMKLGEASIRSINRVIRRTGRIMLEI